MLLRWPRERRGDGGRAARAGRGTASGTTRSSSRPGCARPGWFDLREIAAEILPPSLAGRRCLDVGTFDGFWAFEMERRGAAEVVAIDILDPRSWDWPANSTAEVVAALAERKRGGAGFELAHEALRLRGRATRAERLRPRPGRWSVSSTSSTSAACCCTCATRCGALAAARSVCAGEAVLVDAIDLPRTLLSPPPAGRDARRARASVVVEAQPRRARAPGRGGRVRARPAAPRVSTCRSVRATRGACARRGCCCRPPDARQLLNSWRGDPHGVIVARPAAG